MDAFPGPVVEPEWLRARLDQGTELVVADVRWVPDGSARKVFERGHLPGAVLLDADRDLAAPPFDGPGRHPLPSPEMFAATMMRAGIGDGIPVVVYDDARDSIAARLWWMLDVIGHPAAVLDGGLDAWGGPTETGPGLSPEPATFTARPWPGDRLADAAKVQAALGDAGALIVDVRASERYRGDIEPFDAKAGHIPGTRNAPWTGNVDPETGRFLSVAAMRARWSELGVDDADRVIVHCGSGLTACHTILSMRLAGLGQARLYEGSWSDWISDPVRPIATGDG
jgi:thiosulfate/3-mercaptopyruvate sulfurtransferase